MVTHEWFDNPVIVVPKSQEADYRKYYGELVVAIADELDGSAPRKRNAVLNLYPGENILMVDDDMTAISRRKNKIPLGKQEIAHLAENAFLMCSEIGAGMWGINMNLDPMKHRDFHPLSLTKPVYWFVGILPDDIRYDERLLLGEDLDFYLQKLNKYRKVLRFNNYQPEIFLSKEGGIQQRDKWLECHRIVEQKWGSDIVHIKDTS